MPPPASDAAAFFAPQPWHDAGSQVSGVNVAKFMHKPSAFGGFPGEDVDNALFAIEMYLATARIPVQSWPIVATTMVKGPAFQAWMNIVQPLKRAGIEPTWAHFCKCLRDAFGVPDKELAARKAFRTLRQRNMSLLEYVRHANHLLNQIVTSPPSEADKTVTLFEGLNKDLKDRIPINQQTNRKWQTYDELASFLINLATEVPHALHTERTDSFKPRSRTPPRPFMPRSTFSASIQAPRPTLPRPPQVHRPPHTFGMGRGGRGGAGRGNAQGTVMTPGRGPSSSAPNKKAKRESVHAAVAALKQQVEEQRAQLASLNASK